MNFKNKHLIIFDFDETLCKSNALVYLKDKKTLKVIQSFSPQEYVSWREANDYESNTNKWVFDFSEFSGFPKKGEPVRDSIELLNRYLKDTWYYTVALVTGRDELSGPRAFLKKQGVDVNNIFFLCSGDPNKRMCYESLINTIQPECVTIFEDCQIYIDQCKEVCSKYDVRCSGILVKETKITTLEFEEEIV